MQSPIKLSLTALGHSKDSWRTKLMIPSLDLSEQSPGYNQRKDTVFGLHLCSGNPSYLKSPLNRNCL